MATLFVVCKNREDAEKKFTEDLGRAFRTKTLITADKSRVPFHLQMIGEEIMYSFTSDWEDQMTNCGKSVEVKIPIEGGELNA